MKKNYDPSDLKEIKNPYVGLKHQKIHKGVIGVAGEYYVAAELSRRGYIVTLTQRNSKAVDILVANADESRFAKIQVKTTLSKQNKWMLNEKAETLSDKTLFYVFVGLDADVPPRFYVVPSPVVARTVKKDYQEWMGTPGRNGKPHGISTIRIFIPAGERYLSNWEILGL